MKINNSQRSLAMNKRLFSDLISLCKNYLPKEDLAIISSMNMEPPMNILKQKCGIQFTQINSRAMRNGSWKNTFHLTQSETLDYLFAIDIVNKFENIASIIKMIGALIKPQGIFAFTYERINNRISNEEEFDPSQSMREDLRSFPIKDGVIQKLLINNNFYIQHELDYQISPNKGNDFVLFVAQKK